MNPNCIKCNDKVQDGAVCSKCHLVYHYHCVALTEVGWRRLGSERQATWLCPDCKNNAPLSSPRNPAQGKPFDVSGADSTMLKKIEAMLASLSDLPGLVERLRSEVSDLNSRLSNQVIEELNHRLSDIETRLTDVDLLKKEQDRLNTAVKSYEERLRKIEKSDKQQNELISDLQRKSKSLEIEYNKSQQQSRFLNVELVGVPENPKENLPLLLLRIATMIDANIQADDIEFITRVQSHHPQAGRPRRIVAKLRNRKAKDSIITNFKKLNKSKGITSKDLGFEENSTKVFINEHLTIANKILLNNCRQRAQELNIKFVWVKNCSIFMRCNEASPPILINSVEDIRRNAI